MTAPLETEAEGTLSPEALIALYRAMARIRVVDERMATLQRAGRVGFYGVCTGQKAAAYGLPGVKVDGNDVEAVFRATAQAVARARRGEGPTLIEAETYRVSAHSSADDPSRYREEAEVEGWRQKDPLLRTRTWLVASGLWDEARERALQGVLLEEVNAAIREAESLPPVSPESLFEDVYARLPWHLEAQRSELQEFLRWRAAGHQDG
jgi:pyruvate dehydrogenase E1 component alpha subunit/2-oxoisovalerate dehydrogenase E1 component alpha subunit